MNDLLSPSTRELTRSSTYHPGVKVPPRGWLQSSSDIPFGSTDLVRKRHWLEPVSTNFLPESSNLTEEERYFDFWHE
jgi:hypothetical protein